MLYSAGDNQQSNRPNTLPLAIPCPGAASGAVLSRLAALAPHAAQETSNEIPIDNKLPTAAARQLNYLQAGRYFSRLGAPTTKPAGQQRIASPYSVISTDIDWAL